MFVEVRLTHRLLVAAGRAHQKLLLSAKIYIVLHVREMFVRLMESACARVVRVGPQYLVAVHTISGALVVQERRV